MIECGPVLAGRGATLFLGSGLMERLDCDRMFVAVLELGSFARAAEKLGTSSGQASKLVSKLEADLGVQLLKRTTRSLSATEVGRAYYERVKVLVEEFDALDASVRQASGLPAGRLRISAPTSFGSLQLTPALLEFARAYPDIQLDVNFSDRLVNLVDEGFDAAIRIGMPADSSLIARKLCDARIVLVASPDYLAGRPAPASIAELAEQDCILDTNFRDPEIWPLKDEGGEVGPLRVAGRLRLSSGEACLAAAEAGLGICYLPSFIAGPRIREGAVIRLLPQSEIPPFSIHALYPPARHLALKVRVLIDFLVKRYRSGPVWDQGW